MDDERSVAVSPRHHVVLARELLVLLERPPRTDFVVRTLAKREANGMPLMTAEMVVASEETRRQHPLAATYPLHFRKTYFPGRLHGDPRDEYENHLRASELCAAVTAPIGYGDNVFRSCLIPGRPYARLTPFGSDPPESNIAIAEKRHLAEVIGLWRLAEEMFAHLKSLHEGGLAHGDAELHNCIVCPAPLECILIDFEAAIRKDALSEAAWKTRCELDFEPLLREAIYLQCALGQQTSPLGKLSFCRLEQLFRSPESFRRAIEIQAHV